MRIENNTQQPVDARIEIVAGGRGTRTKPKVAAGSVHTETLPRLPRDPAEPLNVAADIVAGGRNLRITKQLYYAPVAGAAIEVDGESGDWRGIRRIQLQQWHRSTRTTLSRAKGTCAGPTVSATASTLRSTGS